MNDWKNLRAVLTICAALGWWGIWFPELAVRADAVCVVQEENNISVQKQENVVEYEAGCYAGDPDDRKDAYEIYNGLLHADKEQIRVKSRLFELLHKYFGSEESCR